MTRRRHDLLASAWPRNVPSAALSPKGNMVGSKQRDGLFYDAFEQHAACLVDAAKLLLEMFAHVDKAAEIAERIRDIEHKGDRITHDTIARLHKTWITPLDSSDTATEALSPSPE